jgi:ribosomal protein S18 acetylase RimI-like enzyme
MHAKKCKIRTIRITDYHKLINLWRNTEGMGITVSDSRNNVNKYLKRNKGFSFAALSDENQIIGTILAGHDGKRGYIYHLAVDKNYRRSGIGKELVNKSLLKLRSAGIPKCTLFVYNKNIGAKCFWSSLGWFVRKDLTIMQYMVNK